MADIVRPDVDDHGRSDPRRTDVVHQSGDRRHLCPGVHPLVDEEHAIPLREQMSSHRQIEASPQIVGRRDAPYHPLAHLARLHILPDLGEADAKFGRYQTA